MKPLTIRDRDRSKRAPVRRFGLLDAMIIVVALAPLCVILRDRYEMLGTQGSPTYYKTIDAIVTVSNSFLITFTFAAGFGTTERLRTTESLRQSRRPGIPSGS